MPDRPEAVHICPSATLAGRVTVGDETFIGMGCNIIQCLKIGSQAMIGAGAVVMEDVPDGAHGGRCSRTGRSKWAKASLEMAGI